MGTMTDTICINCGKAGNMEYDNEFYCEDCFNDNFYLCGYCQEYFPKDDMVKIDGDYCCEDCASENFTYCENCSECFPNADVRFSEVDQRFYCEYCFNRYYTYCAIRGREIAQSDCQSFEGDYCCEDCFNNHHGYCDNCQEYYPLDELTYSDENDCYLCGNCYVETTTIQSYSFKPKPEFFKNKNEKNEKFNFGLELEVENSKENISNDEMAKAIEEKYWYFKYDGSLDNGFEIVTHPFTYNYYKSTLKEKFENLLNKLKSNGFSSYASNTCGIHIHLSKDAFSTTHLYKFMKFVYENENFILLISQRQQAQLNTWANISYSKQGLVNRAKTKKNDSEEHSRRYTACNLTSHTLEVRVFRGTLNVTSFHKNIEFLKALYDFTLMTGIKDINIKNFKTHILKNSKQYNCLVDFLSNKHFFN